MAATQQEIENRLWDAADELRVAMPEAQYSSVVFPLMFWKYLSDTWEHHHQEFLEENDLVSLSAEEAREIEYRDYQSFEIPCIYPGTVTERRASWSSILATITQPGLGQRVRASLQAIETANPGKFSRLFGSMTWTSEEVLSGEVLAAVMQAMDHTPKMHEGNMSHDVLGGAYEYLLKRFSDGSGTRAGQFFTPREVVELLVELLEPRGHESVYDPTCGSGGMLIASANLLKAHGGRGYTLKLYGQEAVPDTAGVARMNLFMHNLTQFQVEVGDTLKDPRFKKPDGSVATFDVILANPPYSLKWKPWTNDPRALGGVAPQSSADWAFVQHMIASMDPKKGRAGVVLPHGVLFRGGQEAAIRRRVLDDKLLEAVIGLPANLFYNTSIPTAILVFRAPGTKTLERQEGVLLQVLRLLRGRKEFRDADGVWHALKVIDLEHPAANTLVVSDEVTITVPGKTSRRFDLVYWVNGLPLVVVEVKSPTAKSGWADAAREINDVYVTEYPWFFTPNVFAVASDGLKLRFGAAGAPTNLWQPFRFTADDENLAGQADAQRSVELLLNPATVLDMLANFVPFDTAGGGVDKKYLPRYPQMEAAHLIHQRVLAAGSKGLIWHHQGSGKTLLMVFAASLLLAGTRTDSPTIILLSDRTQLVRQTSGVFTSAMGDAYFHQPATSAELRAVLADDVRGVISTTVHKFADAGKNLSTRDNVIVLVDEAHRTQSARSKSLAGQMRAALPHAKFFGMTGTPVRNLATDTFALFGEESDPGRVLHRYSVSRSLLDEATVPVMLEPHPVAFEINDQALQAEFDQFADDFDLDDPKRETLSRKFGRLTSVFANPNRVRAVCQHIVDHYLAGAYRNGLKAQIFAFNRELAVAYTDKINELLAGFEASQVLAEVGKHDRITAEVNISVSDSKDEDPDMRPFRLSEAEEEEEQKRRFLAPDDPLCFLVVTAKLMTGFDAPNEGVLYLDKPLKAHTLFQTITRPNRTCVSPTGFVKTAGVVVDYIGLAEEVQRAVTDPTAKGAGKGGGFVTDLFELVAEFRTTFARIEDLLVDVDGLDLTVHGYESVRAINVFLDANPGAAEVFSKDYRYLARLYPLINTDKRITKYRDGFGLFGSVYTTLFKKSSDEERKERLAELGPMVLEIINAHVHSFSVVASQEEPLVLDAQGIAILKELLALVRPKPDKDDGEDKKPPSAAEILDHIKAALDKGVDPGSAKYTALAERIKQLRDRIIQNAQDALEFLSEALRVARAIVDAEKHPDEAVVVLDDDHVGVLSRIIHDHAPPRLHSHGEEPGRGDRPGGHPHARPVMGQRRCPQPRRPPRHRPGLPAVCHEAGWGAIRLHRRLHRSLLPR